MLKLPEELELPSMLNALDQPVQEVKAMWIELLVRDCADTAFFLDDGSCTSDSKAAAERILARYGLSPQEDLRHD